MRCFWLYFVFKFLPYFVFGLETFCVVRVLPLLYFVFSIWSSSTSCSILDVSYFVFGTDYFVYYV